MRISDEGKIGLAIALVAIAGGGAVVVAHGSVVLVIGWGMIAAALVGGILLAHHHFAHRRMIPLIGMILFGLGFLGCAAWYSWPVSQKAPEAGSQPVALPSPPLGSLQYVTFAPIIQRKVSTKTASVQMAVELKNTNNFMLKLHVKLAGAVNHVQPDPLNITFDTFVAAHATRGILYTRINDVPEEKFDAGKPSLAGAMTYDISYWAADNPNGKKRHTSKQCVFEIPDPLVAKRPNKGTVREQQYKITVTCQNEIEE